MASYDDEIQRRSYFPAANLRQFQGTELAPPGAGTYYKPSRYAGAPANLQRRAARELAKQYQQDLEFNVMANPNVARSLEAERIGAQYGGGKSFAGKKGYQTVQLPGGGSTVVTDATAKRLLSKPGYSTGATRPSQAAAFNLGFYGTPGVTLPNPYGTPSAVPRTPFERLYATGYTGGREGVGVTQPPPALPNLGALASSALSGIGRMFGFGRPQLATSQTASAPIGYHTDFTGTPSALQESFGQPRRYFDF